MLGKLTWSAIPFDQPIPLIAGATVGLVIAGYLGGSSLQGIFHIFGANGSLASTTSGSA